MSNSFIHFKDIQVEETNSWSNKFIISFDIDWASDEVLNHLVELVESYNVKCVFFITHNTPVLKRIISNPNFELGLHPNFNPLLENRSSSSVEQIINELKTFVPEVNVLRSHSLTTSGRWLGLYQKCGIKYLSNYMMRGVNNIQPFYHINGLVEVPIYYADDGEIFLNDDKSIPRLKSNFDSTQELKGIRVLNFHPIHITLNSSSYKQYESAKLNQHSYREMLKLKDTNARGSETILKEILEHGKK